MAGWSRSLLGLTEPRNRHIMLDVMRDMQMRRFLGVIGRPVQATCEIPRGWLQAQEEVAGVVFGAGVQDIPGGDLQGIVPGAGNRLRDLI